MAHFSHQPQQHREMLDQFAHDEVCEQIKEMAEDFTLQREEKKLLSPEDKKAQ